MAENYTPQTVGTFVNDTSAVGAVNANFAAISSAFLDVLSRSGVSPNQMNSNLDMNSNQIINLPPPSTTTSPVRLVDIANGNITVTTATTGTSGHAVPFLDGNNIWSGTQNFSLPSLGTSNGITINETASGNIPSGYNANVINITDSINAGANSSSTWQVNLNFGGSSAQGARYAVVGSAQLTSPTSSSNANRNYIGVLGQSIASAGDNGTGLAFNTAAGNFVGGLFQAEATGSAGDLLGVNSLSASITMASGSSCWQKTCITAGSSASDVANGSAINAIIELFNESGATAKWSQGLLIDNGAGTQSFPIATSGTLIKATAGSVAAGIDFTGMTFSSSAIATPGFVVGTTGNVALGNNSGNLGTLFFNGSSSGTAEVVTNSTATQINIGVPILVGNTGVIGGSLTLAGLTSGSTALSVSSTGSNLLLGAGNVTISNTGSISTAGLSFFVANSTVTPAGGASNTGIFLGLSNYGIYFGSGAPTVSAAQGSLYIRSDGSSTSTRFYVNTNGSTGWTNFTSAT